MSQDLNIQQFTGNLGRAPECRDTQSGTRQATLSLGVSSWKKDEETGKNKTDWIRVVAYGKQAEIIEKFCDVGTKIAVVTRLETGSYVNKEGATVYTTDFIAQQVVLLGKTKGGGANGEGEELFPGEEDAGNNGSSSGGSYSGGGAKKAARPVVRPKSGNNPF